MVKPNKLRQSTSVLITIVVALSCAHKTTPASSKTNEAKLPSPKSINTENIKSMMAKGEEIYRTKCTRCHGVPETSAYTSNRWDRIINEMAPKAKLDITEKNAVLTYVKAGAR